MTLKSNSVKIFDFVEPILKNTVLKNTGGDLADGSVDVRYVYNYYVQDELTKTAESSLLVNATGKRYELEKSTSESALNSRPPTYKEPAGELFSPVENLPRYVEITLPGYTTSQAFQIVSARNSFGLVVFVETETLKLSAEELDSVRRKVISESFQDYINFEETLTESGNENEISLLDIVLDSPRSFAGGVPFSATEADPETADLLSELPPNLELSTSTTKAALSVRQDGIGSILCAAGIGGDPSFSKTIISAISGDNNTYNKLTDAARNNQVTKPNLDSVYDSIANTFEESSIDLIEFSEMPSGFPLVEFRNTIDAPVSTDIRPSTFQVYPIGFLIYQIEESRIDGSPSDNQQRQLVGLVPPTAKKFSLGSIKHGHAYTFEIRFLNLINQKIVDEESSSSDARYLIASRPFRHVGNRETIFTDLPDDIVNIEPPPAINFYRKKSDLIVSLQAATHRAPFVDVTKHLLFTRRSPQEPFQMIQCKSQFQDQKGDPQINESTRRFRGEVTVKPGQHQNFVIKDFPFETGLIIAAASVDAHGKISDYSAQFRVRESAAGSRVLNVELVADSKCPLQLPNLLLRPGFGGSTLPQGSQNRVGETLGELASSAVKVSGYKKFSIVPSFGLGGNTLGSSRGERALKVDDHVLVPVTVAGETGGMTLTFTSLTDESSSEVEVRFTTAE
jgi:hypothetical protein